MSASPFRKAEKRAVKLRAAIDGPTGAGKTISALKIARGLVGPKGSIAVIDTEHGTAEKFYARITDFDTVELTKYQPTDYVKMIEAASAYDCLIIDSLSHAWSEGVLPMVDAKGGRFDAWKDVTPHHARLVNALLTFPGHLIVTMRTKMAYEVDKDEKTGKTRVEKLGLKPVQREGLEYEFDLVMDIDRAHRLTVSKSRVSELADRSLIEPGEDFGAEIGVLIADGIAERPNTEALARELAATAGPANVDELKKQLKTAGIAMADLADEKKLAKARSLAEGLAALSADPLQAEVAAALSTDTQAQTAAGEDKA
jgi:hypothetical protein